MQGLCCRPVLLIRHNLSPPRYFQPLVTSASGMWVSGQPPRVSLGGQGLWVLILQPLWLKAQGRRKERYGLEWSLRFVSCPFLEFSLCPCGSRGLRLYVSFLSRGFPQKSP